MIADLTEAEMFVIQRLRALKKEAGHGTLRVEVTAGHETLVKREYSEKPPPRSRT